MTAPLYYYLLHTSISAVYHLYKTQSTTIQFCFFVEYHGIRLQSYNLAVTQLSSEK